MSNQLLNNYSPNTKVLPQGIRLEAEKLYTKLIIHNYGQGESGISLSWGCAQEAINIMKQTASKQSSIAIIGSGVIGLTTAHALKEQGYEVTLYSRDFTDFALHAKKVGEWCPDYGLSTLEHQMAQRVRNISLTRFYDLANNPDPEFKGILLVPSYKEESSFNSVNELVENYIIAHINGTSRVCKKDTELAPAFDLYVYLQDLLDKARVKGIKFEHKNIQSANDLLSLPEIIIYNCSGKSIA